MRHSLETALAHDLSDPALRGYINLTATVFGWDRYREALDLSRAGSAVGAEGRGSLRDLGRLDPRHPRHVGRVGRGARDGRDSTRRTTRPGSPSGLTSLWRGEREEVARLLPAIEADTDMNEVQGRAGSELQANVFLADGRPREALAAAEEALADRAELLTVMSPASRRWPSRRRSSSRRARRSTSSWRSSRSFLPAS